MPLEKFRRRINRADKLGTLNALRTIRRAMFERIFKRGEAFRGALGNYRSRQHIRKRLRAGRQVRYKDLFLTGNLARNLQVRNKTIRWNSREAQAIAGYQETAEQTGKIIWRPRADEIQAGIDRYTEIFLSNVFR